MLIETIRINNGKAENLWRHEARAYQSAKMLFHNVEPFSFSEVIAPPAHLMHGICKCRITYSNRILNVEFEAYFPKKITSIALVDAPNLSYDLKFADRTEIQKLKESTTADEILLIRDLLLTDLSYANVAFLRDNRWYTPTRPLLRGTRRQQLIEKGILIETNIFLPYLRQFSALKPINAMLDFHETPPLYIKSNDWQEPILSLTEEKF